MCIAGQYDRNLQVVLGVDRAPSNIIDDAQGFIALLKRIQPSGLWTAKNDPRFRLHALSDEIKVVFLRLIDVVIQLGVHRPDPPFVCELEREIAPALSAAPAA